MSKKSYIISFAILAFLFVPVFFSFVVVSITAPCVYVYMNAISSLFADIYSVPLFIGAHLPFLTLYLALFYLGGWATYWCIEKIPLLKVRIILQVLVLLGLFCCSFLKVIRRDYFVNMSGTYNFWSGLKRFMEISGMF